VHGLQHLEHFFSSLLSAKEFWAAILGALIGGLVAGWFALLAQKQAAKDQRQYAREADRRAANNLLQAIRAELTVQKTGNLNLLQTLKDRYATRAKLPHFGEPFFPLLAIIRTEQNQCIVYDSNADRLGMLDDKILLREIVAFYASSKAFDDFLNTSSRDFERWRQIPGTSAEKAVVERMLWRSEEALRNGLEKLQNDLDALLKKLEDQCAND
jgi:hypothetical protein